MFPPDDSQSPHATPGGFGPTAILKEHFFLSWPEKKESLGSFFFYFRHCYVFWYQGTTQRRLSGEEWFILQPQAWVTPKKPLDKCPRIFAAFLRGTAMLWTWSINLGFRSGSQAESRDVALASSVESHPLTDRHFLSLQSLARVSPHPFLCSYCYCFCHQHHFLPRRRGESLLSKRRDQQHSFFPNSDQRLSKPHPNYIKLKHLGCDLDTCSPVHFYTQHIQVKEC